MFLEITKNLTKYACDQNGDNFANLFSEDGTYHDYIYGSFKGRKDIKMMLVKYFHRDAKNLNWEMYDHVLVKNIGYAKYRFSFISKIPEYLGKKVVISGMCFFRFKSNLITEYTESVNGGIAMVQLGVKPEKMEKTFLKWFRRALEDDSKLKILRKN